MIKRIFFVFAGLYFLIAVATSAKATELALDFTGTGRTVFSNAELTLGWSFQVNESITVDGLGFFDDEISTGPDLHQDHLVSLWNDDGSLLLAQSTITNASTPVPSTAVGGEWLFNDIAPIHLTPGLYIIGALNPECTDFSTCDAFRFSAGTNLVSATTISQITFIENRINVSGNGFPTLTTASRDDGYFGPNLRIAAADVPEPAGLLLLGSGLAALGLWGKKRFKAGS